MVLQALLSYNINKPGRQGTARSETPECPLPHLQIASQHPLQRSNHPFMPSFLSLPREIRDEIYHYSLVSPSGFIAPYVLSRPSTLNPRRRVKASKRKSNNNNNKQLHLITDPLACPPYGPNLDTADFLTHRKGSYITLSLPATCRQIYNETQGLFWKHNTFYFPSIHECGPSLGISRTLKTMGQTSSRLIQTMTIVMPGRSTSYTGFRKVLKTLSSRARLGHFRKLEMIWDEGSFADLMSFLYDSSEILDGLGEDFRDGFEGERFERIVRVPECPKFLMGGDADEETRMELYEGMVRYLHLAVGGTMVCGGRVEWVDRVRVGRAGDRHVQSS